MKTMIKLSYAALAVLLMPATLSACSSNGGTYGTKSDSISYAQSNASRPDNNSAQQENNWSKIEYKYDNEGDPDEATGPFGKPL